MKAPRVSVVVIFLDEERFLGEAIASVRAQTIADWELVLVDDGSRDRSSEIARAAAAADPDRVRHLRHPGGVNRGMSASLNLGLANARGEYVAFLDADDVWRAGKLEEQLACFEATPEAELVYGGTLLWHGWNPASTAADVHAPLGVAANRLYPPPRLFGRLMRSGVQSLATSSVIVRRTLVERIGGFADEFPGIFGDRVFFAKALLVAPVWVDDRTWTKRRVHPASYSERTLGTAGALRTRLRFLEWVATYLAAQHVSALGPRLARARAVGETRMLLWRRLAYAALRGMAP